MAGDTKAKPANADLLVDVDHDTDTPAALPAGPDKHAASPPETAASLLDLDDGALPPKSEAEQPAMDASVATLVPSASTPTLASQVSPASQASESRAASIAAKMHMLDVEASNQADRRIYIDPTPSTPLTTSHPPSRTPSNAGPPSSAVLAPHRSFEVSPARSDALGVDDDKRYASEDDQESGSRSEIQSIMGQFSEEGGGPDEEEVMSPRLGIASPMLTSPRSLQHPPRQSSLEPLAPNLAQHIQDMQGLSLRPASPAVSTNSVGTLPRETGTEGGETTSKDGQPLEKDDPRPPVPPKDGRITTPLPSPLPSIPSGAALRDPSHRHSQHSQHSLHGQTSQNPSQRPRHDREHDTPLSPASLSRPPPPNPEPEPALPFDFQRFLEQLRNKKADPVARYLKSFLQEFAKRQWMVHEQVKIISDFLTFIDNKMAACDVWRELSDTEFDNAREGMEKLVMNRLYTQTFSPAIPPPLPIPGAKPKRRGGDRPMGPGRRGQHQEDVERDEILAQKISIYSWIREEHLDIPPVGDSGKRFLKLAQQELIKVKSYRAPRDKIICVLNCCKVIFGLLKHNKTDSSADSFIPMLIYVVLQANPEHLVSNVQYILRFRNQEKLSGEAGYYLSSLMGAIQFIENMGRTSLTITDDEFEKNVEAAVSAIAEKHRAESPPLPTPPLPSEKEDQRQDHRLPSGEPSSLSGQAAAATRLSSDSDAARLTVGTPRPSFSQDGDDDDSASDERDALTGLLRTFQKPLSTIGRIFSDESAPSSLPASRGRSPGPAGPSSAAGMNVHPGQFPPHTVPGVRLAPGERPMTASSRHSLSAEEAAARQASAEAAEAVRLDIREHGKIVESLVSIFPDLDRDLISDVVHQKQGRVHLAVEACLALSS